MSRMNVTLRDVELRWKNFSGRATDYTEEGKRYFNVVLNSEQVDLLSNVELVTKSGVVIKGANVRTHVPENGDGEPLYTLKVLFGAYPPEEMWRVTPRGKMRLTMETVGNLDREYIERAKVQITLSPYEKGSNRGITAYLRGLIVWIKEDDFTSDEDFQSLPEIGGGVGNGYSAVNSDDEGLPF